MNFKRYASKKVIAIVVAIMVAVGTFINQHHKIKSLQDELYIQQNMTEQKYNYTETSLDAKTIEQDLNSLCEYKILDGKVNIKHTYAYQRDSLFGLKSKYKITGTADLYYELIVELKNATVVRDEGGKYIVQVDFPQVNSEACHRIHDTFIRMDDECSDNILSNERDAEKATRHWEDTFDKKGIEYIKEYYKFDDVQKDIRKVTVRELETLLSELGYSQSLEVIVR